MQQLALGYHLINTFHCQQKKWSSKKNKIISVKSMMRLLHELQYAKRHQSMSSCTKIESVPLAIVDLHLSEGVIQSVSRKFH